MQIYLHYFFEYIVFFALIIPFINELVYLFKPSLVIALKNKIKTDIVSARATMTAQLQMAALVVTICGLFTSQGLLFWLYFLSAIVVAFLQAWKPSLRSDPWFVRIDGLICLVILSFIVLGRFYFHKPVIQYFILWLGSSPEESINTILRAS